MNAFAVGVLRGLIVYDQKPHGDQIEVTAATPCAELRFVTRSDHVKSGLAGVKEAGIIGAPATREKAQLVFEVRKDARAYWQLDRTDAGSASRNVEFPKMEKFFGRLCINEPFPVCFDEADVTKKKVRSSHPGAVFGPPIELK